jgi:hypothetical protein
MTETLRIDSGLKRVAINGDPDRVIEFNPKDVLFMERFYELIREFETKEAEFSERAAQLEQDDAVDSYGLPANAAERIDLMKDICTFLRERIDRVFGSGTSEKAFGDALGLDMFEQFFTGITPFIETARSEKLVRYSRHGKSSVMK